MMIVIMSLSPPNNVKLDFKKSFVFLILCRIISVGWLIGFMSCDPLLGY